MFTLHHVDSLDLSELSPYRTMRRPQAHCNDGIFVAESEKVVRRLLESHFDVVSVLLPERWLATFEPLLAARREEIPVFVVEKKELLESLIGFSMFQGVMAVGKIPSPMTLETVLAESKSPRLLVAVDELSNAENLGVVVRNCVGFGVQALIVGETSSSPYLRRAVRNSMGTIFQLPVVELGRRTDPLDANPKTRRRDAVRTETLVNALRALRERGVRCIAAHPHTDRKTLSQADFKGDSCIVLGSEANGISRPVLEMCDEAVAIPMPPTVDSLNVGSAAAVFLYEAIRQRGGM
ncbi:MAG TPA: RNA methyltransferase [Verrucomicrobiota bacterium]|nr:RNA methyltransferase [Verrucomicrobiota bacterium]